MDDPKTTDVIEQPHSPPTTIEPPPPGAEVVMAGGAGDWWTPSNLTEARQICKWMATSGIVPKDYQDKPENIFVAWMFVAPLRLSLLTGLQYTAVINGKPTLWGDAIPAVVLSRGGSIREWFEGEGDAMTAFCEVSREGHPPKIGRFSVKQAKHAGLWGKNVWASYPQRMLQMRARAFGCRDQFPDALSGINIAEEEMGVPPDKNITADVAVTDTPKAGNEALKAKLQPSDRAAVAEQAADHDAAVAENTPEVACGVIESTDAPERTDVVWKKLPDGGHYEFFEGTWLRIADDQLDCFGLGDPQGSPSREAV